MNNIIEGDVLRSYLSKLSKSQSIELLLTLNYLDYRKLLEVLFQAIYNFTLKNIDNVTRLRESFDLIIDEVSIPQELIEKMSKANTIGEPYECLYMENYPFIPYKYGDEASYACIPPVLWCKYVLEKLPWTYLHKFRQIHPIFWNFTTKFMIQKARSFLIEFVRIENDAILLELMTALHTPSERHLYAGCIRDRTHASRLYKNFFITKIEFETLELINPEEELLIAGVLKYRSLQALKKKHYDKIENLRLENEKNVVAQANLDQAIIFLREIYEILSVCSILDNISYHKVKKEYFYDKNYIIDASHPFILNVLRLEPIFIQKCISRRDFSCLASTFTRKRFKAIVNTCPD